MMRTIENVLGAILLASLMFVPMMFLSRPIIPDHIADTGKMVEPTCKHSLQVAPVVKDYLTTAPFAPITVLPDMPSNVATLEATDTLAAVEVEITTDTVWLRIGGYETPIKIDDIREDYSERD